MLSQFVVGYVQTKVSASRGRTMAKLVHPELSYRVRGVLLDVHRRLGPLLREAYYRDAIVIGLEKRGIPCVPEKFFEVHYRENRAGRYFVDVWVDGGKLLLELKVAPEITPLHRAQTISYLKVTDADLAIVANFGRGALDDERLPNFVRDRRSEFSWQPQEAAQDLLYPELVNSIQRVCHRVHFELGPGFLHQVYRRATLTELRLSGLGYRYIHKLPIVYQGCVLGQQEVRLILVEGKILLAAFALRAEDEERIQAWTERLKVCLRRLGLHLGLLANFHDTRLAMMPVRVRSDKTTLL